MVIAEVFTENYYKLLIGNTSDAFSCMDSQVKTKRKYKLALTND